MKKDIKDYLPFYLGQEMKWTNAHPDDKTTQRLVGVNDYGFYLKGNNTVFRFDSTTKILLRPLSDMTEMEIIKLLTIPYKKIFSYDPDIKDCQLMIESENSIGLKCIDRIDDGEIGFTIEVDRGIELTSGTSNLIVNQFECTKWLLSKGFDLFGLIEAGIAINKTTLK